MSIKRCVLCDGRIVNQRCEDCGMDFSRWENRYYLNDEGSVEQMRKGQLSQQRIQPPKKTPTKQAQQRIQPPKKTPAKQAQQRTRVSNQAKAGHRKKMQAEFGSEKPKKVIGRITLLITVIAFVVSVASTLLEYFRYSADTAEVWDESTSAYDDLYDDPYAYAVDEMPNEGDDYLAELGKGSYYGGKQLPVGSYTVILLGEGYGDVGLYDDRNLIYYHEYLDNEDVTVLEDVRLYEGTQIEIEGNITVQLESHNAQINTMKEAQENPLKDTVPMQGRMIAGEDFEPGIYDIHVTSGYGTVNRTERDADYYDWYTWLDEEEPAQNVYLNKEFLEGDILEFDEYSSEDFKVELVPSEQVYPQ